jgi:carotenoid cleavage dioxygenase
MDWLNGHLKGKFDAARSKAWTDGFVSIGVQSMGPTSLPVRGEIPSSLRGTFYRNGPGRHELGQGRYGHVLDGDGFLHAFRFASDGVTHQGRFVLTRKYQTESAAGRFLVSGFGSSLHGPRNLSEDIDDLNAANTNVRVFNGELLALWEAGSAHHVDQQSLGTFGVKQWSSRKVLRPFSAHPRIDRDGVMWNFGCNPITGVLSIYQIAADGTLVACKRMKIESLPPVHDFAVTDRHLVFVIAPWRFSVEELRQGRSFAAASSWMPMGQTRVLVVAKNDWSLRWYELPPMAALHIGNAWEDPNGTIRFDMMATRDPRAMVGGWTLMRGFYSHLKGPVMTLVELQQRGAVRWAAVGDLEGEFPVVDPSMVGVRYREVLCLSRSATRPAELPGWDGLAAFDPERGVTQAFSFGNDWALEEHVYAPDATDPGQPSKWIVGVAMDLRERQTVLLVFSASALAQGPVAMARLPGALPFGLHGTFHAVI